MGFRKINRKDTIKELRNRLSEQSIFIPKDFGLELEDFIVKDDMTTALAYMLDNCNWSQQDKLPTGDPIGDVEETYNRDERNYSKMMEKRVLVAEGKYFGALPDIDIDNKCCHNPANHKKVHLITSAYKICTQCKSDLGDWE